MINADNEFVLKIQDKDTKFRFVEKKTDKEKAMSRFERVTVEELILTQLHHIFKK